MSLFPSRSLSRIERQQAFLTSLIQKVTSSDVLFNPLELYSFLDAVTGAVTTDQGIGSIRSMASVAVRVRGSGRGMTIRWRMSVSM